MPKRRLLFDEDETQRVLQVAKEKLPEDPFQVLQQVVTSYARLTALVREGTTTIDRLREMFKIKRCPRTDVGDDGDTRPQTPPPGEHDGLCADV